MVGIYLAVACVAVIIVAVFVDNLPSDLVDSKANVRSEVFTMTTASGAHRSSILVKLMFSHLRMSCCVCAL